MALDDGDGGPPMGRPRSPPPPIAQVFPVGCFGADRVAIRGRGTPSGSVGFESLGRCDCVFRVAGRFCAFVRQRSLFVRGVFFEVEGAVPDDEMVRRFRGFCVCVRVWYEIFPLRGSFSPPSVSPSSRRKRKKNKNSEKKRIFLSRRVFVSDRKRRPPRPLSLESRP